MFGLLVLREMGNLGKFIYDVTISSISEGKVAYFYLVSLLLKSLFFFFNYFLLGSSLCVQNPKTTMFQKSLPELVHSWSFPLFSL
jgi:hypothetical protein